MNIPPVTPIPHFRPGERHEEAADRRRSRENEKDAGHDGAFTGRLPSAEDNPADRDEGSDRGRLTDQTV